MLDSNHENEVNANTVPSDGIPTKEASPDYPYRNVALTQKMASEIILRIVKPDEVFSRSSVTDRTVKYHTDLGGLVDKNRLPRIIGKAFTILKESDEIIKIRYDRWRLAMSVQGDNAIGVEVDTGDEEDETPTDQQFDNARKKLKTVKEIGDTEIQSVVYVYYWQAYRTVAEGNNNDKWPCKVGYSKYGVAERLAEQIQTAWPEYPIVALAIHLTDAKGMELVLHKALENRGRKINDAPGNEWFVTSPDEIEEILYCINPSLRSS